MDADPETTVQLLPGGDRRSVDTISLLEEPLRHEEGGEATGSAGWSDGDDNGRERSVSTKYMIILTCGTFG